MKAIMNIVKKETLKKIKCKMKTMREYKKNSSLDINMNLYRQTSTTEVSLLIMDTTIIVIPFLNPTNTQTMKPCMPNSDL